MSWKKCILAESFLPGSTYIYGNVGFHYAGNPHAHTYRMGQLFLAFFLSL